MKTALCITAAGGADRRGIVGSTGYARDWSSLGIDPLRDRLRWRALFDTPFPGARHLDRLSRMACAVTECAGLPPRAAPPDDRTAIVAVSEHGCLDADWHFEASLGSARGTQAGLFPYTLPSTVLGVLAMRYGLAGATLAYAAPAPDHGAALAEAYAWVREGEASRALVCLGDWVGEQAAAGSGVEGDPRLACVLVEPGDALESTPVEAGALLRADDPTLHVLERLRRAHAD